MDVYPVPRIAGALLFRPAPHVDERGFFSRTFDAEVMRAAGIDPAGFAQDSLSRSRRGVVRGLHIRRGDGEAKLVRCSYGAIFDVIVDLRPGSPTYRNWESFELRDERADLAVRAGRLRARLSGPHRPRGRLLPHRPPARSGRGRVDRLRRSRTGHPVAAPGGGHVVPGPDRPAAHAPRSSCWPDPRSPHDPAQSPVGHPGLTRPRSSVRLSSVSPCD